VLRFCRVTFVALLFACAPEVAPTETPAAGPGVLRSTAFPADFDFATTRNVQMQVRAGALTLPRGADIVEVRRTDGSLVFQGALRAGVPLDLNLSLPSADREVEIRVGGERTVRAVRVPVTTTELDLDS
jgi:hypothetical protein